MINRKLVSTLSIALCTSMISITATASCEDILKIANDTLAQNNPLGVEQKTALKECVKDGCQNYSWTLNCSHIRNLVNTPSASTPITAPVPAPQVQPVIKNINEPTPPPVLNNTIKQPTNDTTKNANTTSTTTTPSNNNVNWF